MVFGFPKDTKAATFTHINGFLWKKGDSDGSNWDVQRSGVMRDQGLRRRGRGVRVGRGRAVRALSRAVATVSSPPNGPRRETTPEPRALPSSPEHGYAPTPE